LTGSTKESQGLAITLAVAVIAGLSSLIGLLNNLKPWTLDALTYAVLVLIFMTTVLFVLVVLLLALRWKESK